MSVGTSCIKSWLGLVFLWFTFVSSTNYSVKAILGYPLLCGSNVSINLHPQAGPAQLKLHFADDQCFVHLIRVPCCALHSIPTDNSSLSPARPPLQLPLKSLCRSVTLHRHPSPRKSLANVGTRVIAVDWIS